MKGKPILFNGPMVRALLDGRKTQTRRVAQEKNKPFPWRERHADTPFCQHSWPARRVGMHCPDCSAAIPLLCPHGGIGSLLWVRETWGCTAADFPGVRGGRKPQPGDKIQYRANGADAWQWREPGALPWQPSIHMPRWASRLTLRVTDVRVERVREITPADAIREGIARAANSQTIDCDTPNPRDAFAALWNSINAKRGYGWDENPWVWVLSFDVLRRNIDEVQS